MDKINFTVNNLIIFLLLISLFTAFVIVIARKKGLERVRGVVYKAFVVAEEHFAHGENKKKFKYVVDIAKLYIPDFYLLFISDELLEETIQLWFDSIKDMLDDGTLNKSIKLVSNKCKEE